MPPTGILVLSRKRGEAIMITDQNGTLLVKVIIMAIRGDKVRLGFQALKHIIIDRQEVYYKRQKDRAMRAIKSLRGGLDHG